VLPLLAGTILANPAAPPAHTTGCTSPSSPEATAVKVTAARDGDLTRFFVENNEYSEITMTLDMSVVNLKGSVEFPYTATFPARKVTEAFTLSPVECGAKWEYTYTNYYKLGSNCAQHDDDCLYELPYGPGSKFKVTQGYNGKFSHTGSNQYAIDWQMPEGTLVRAARAGVVVRVKDDSEKGGPSMDFDRFNNYILIRHSDGTLGHYCHLQKRGCLVSVGQTVSAGEFIAHSGNTGFSSGAHLHFCVFKTKDGRTRLSLPVKFKTSEERGVTLLSGHAYRAPEMQSASARLSASNTGTGPVIR
jgi:murein DD-endopeptidase MepM/ murein hydrolase activator NlpD